MKNNKPKFSLRKQYSESWKYLKSSSNFVWIIVGIFVLFAFVGYFVQLPEALFNQLLDFLKKIVEKTQGMSQSKLTLFIFFNNLEASFLGMILGVFFGIFSVLTALFNGFVLGFVAQISVNNVGFASLWRILPHGIFELPAIFISLALGLKMGISLIFGGRYKSFMKNLKDSIWVFLLMAIPLLIVAAIIEAWLIILLG